VLEIGVEAGYGSRSRIWEDPWLPREWTRRPITPPRNNLLVRVDELIDQKRGIWDEELVRYIFWTQDVELTVDTH